MIPKSAATISKNCGFFKLPAELCNGIYCLVAAEPHDIPPNAFSKLLYDQNRKRETTTLVPDATALCYSLRSIARVGLPIGSEFLAEVKAAYFDIVHLKYPLGFTDIEHRVPAHMTKQKLSHIIEELISVEKDS